MSIKERQSTASIITEIVTALNDEEAYHNGSKTPDEFYNEYLVNIERQKMEIYRDATEEAKRWSKKQEPKIREHYTNYCGSSKNINFSIEAELKNITDHKKNELLKGRFSSPIEFDKFEEQLPEMLRRNIINSIKKLFVLKREKDIFQPIELITPDTDNDINNIKGLLPRISPHLDDNTKSLIYNNPYFNRTF